jgi:SAM-dependent methyltransferase
MSANPLSDVVSSQYARWMYPQPILDIRKWLTSNWQWFDPSHSHRMLWPDRNACPNIDILVAGCGTNQAAVLAYTNPTARVVAIDVSQPSLDHHQYLKSRYGMSNLELHLLPVEDAGRLGLEFDLIISTGVLHHLAVPEAGTKALAQCLRPEGVMALMLYAKYGRTGVEMMQGVFRDMGLVQNDRSVLMVREALACLPPDHPLRSYMTIAPDVNYDAGLVDTFLHGRERCYTVAECIALVEAAGLVFQDLFIKAPYHVHGTPANAFLSAATDLPEQKLWQVMERINFRNGCHFFMACHPDRPSGSYRIDFASPAAEDYVPSLRYRCGLNGRQLFRHDWTMTLDPQQLALMQLVDGHRSIRDIAAEAGRQNLFGTSDADTANGRTRSFLRSLWRLDFLAMGIRPGA